MLNSFAIIDGDLTRHASELSSGHAGSSRRSTSHCENRVTGNFVDSREPMPKGLSRWFPYAPSSVSNRSCVAIMLCTPPTQRMMVTITNWMNG